MTAIYGDLKLGFGIGIGVLLAFLVWSMFQMLTSRMRGHHG